MAARRAVTRTGGRPPTTGTIAGDFALSVGMPDRPAPEGWRWRKITDVARLETGHTPSRKHPDYWGGDVPWIGIKDATGNHGRTICDTIQHTNELGIANSSARILPANTVCLSRTASVGYVVVMGRPMATSQDFVNWVCSPNLDHRFLKYVLLSEQAAFLRFASGTTHQTIYFPEVKAFHVCLPPPAEQATIGHILQSLDDKIEVNRRMSATLEAMARALFKSWFVDFEPVRAKSQGRDPGLPPHLAALFPGRLVETEHGEIPEGWRWGMLGWIANNPRRSAQPAEIPEGTPYIALEHMPRQSLALGEWARADGVESNKYWFEKEQVLFGKLRPYFHKVGIAPVDGVCSTDIVVLGPSEPEWWSFLALVASSVEFVAYTDQGSTGTKMPRTSWPEMSRYVVAMPRREVAACFEQMIRPSLERIVSSVHQSRTPGALRDTLLPKLISGELRVKDAEKAVEAAL